MNRIADKLYLKDPYRRECEATVVGVTEGFVLLDRTVFFPEGGGQVGDLGTIGGVPVLDTLKHGGHVFVRPDFPLVTVGSDVKHVTAPPAELSVGETVVATIDWERRYRIMRLHSAAHFAYHYAFEVFGEMRVKGCRIDPETARFDFATSITLDADRLREVQERANAAIASGEEMQSSVHPDESEALTWSFRDIRIPCGGTHVRSTAEIGSVRLRRKRQGKGLERLYITIPEPSAASSQ